MSDLWKCGDCGEKFETEKELREHQKWEDELLEAALE